MPPVEPVPPRRTVTLIGPGTKIGIVLALALLLGCAAVAFHSVFHQHGLSATERVIGAVIGVGFGGMGLLFLIDLPGMLGRHTLTFDHDGLAYRVTISWVRSFRVSWTELAAVQVSMATRDDRSGRATVVRLDLTPNDAAHFAARHPGLARVRAAVGAGADVWRIPLGPDGSLIAPITAALADYAGPRFHGVHDDGRATGWTYR